MEDPHKLLGGCGGTSPPGGSRDCAEPLGDIGLIARKYEAATGDRIDKNAVEFHTAGWSLMTPFPWEHSVRHPAPTLEGWK
jgi:hypothetical protein